MYNTLKEWYWIGQQRALQMRLDTLKILENEAKSNVRAELAAIERERIAIRIRLGKVSGRLLQYASVRP